MSHTESETHPSSEQIGANPGVESTQLMPRAIIRDHVVYETHDDYVPVAR